MRPIDRVLSSRFRWIVAAVCVTVMAGCGASVDPMRVQEAIDAAQTAVRKAESASDTVSHQQAKRLFEASVKLQRDGESWDSYNAAVRASYYAELAQVEANERATRRRFEALRQSTVESEIALRTLAAQTEATRREIAEIRQARAEADALGARNDAATARSEADAATDQAQRDIERARAETALDKARFAFELASEFNSAEQDPTGHNTASRLIDEAQALFDDGDFRRARLRGMDAFRAANDTRLMARGKQGAERTQANQERTRQAMEAAWELGGAAALMDEAARLEADADEDATPLEQAYVEAKSLYDSESFVSAKRKAAGVQRLAQRAIESGRAQKEQIATERDKEEQIAQIKDAARLVGRKTEELPDFVKEAAANLLAAARSLVKNAEALMDSGNLKLAAENAEAALALLHEAEDHARQVEEDEAALLDSASRFKNVQAFTTAKGVVYRVTGDLFAPGKTEVDNAMTGRIAAIDKELSAYASRYRIRVEGHTDSTGSAQTNLSLSKTRAAAFAALLAACASASPEPIETAGYGSRQLISGIPGADARNRRIEIIALTRAEPVVSSSDPRD